MSPPVTLTPATWQAALTGPIRAQHFLLAPGNYAAKGTVIMAGGGIARLEAAEGPGSVTFTDVQFEIYGFGALRWSAIDWVWTPDEGVCPFQFQTDTVAIRFTDCQAISTGKAGLFQGEANTWCMIETSPDRDSVWDFSAAGVPTMGMFYNQGASYTEWRGAPNPATGKRNRVVLKSPAMPMAAVHLAGGSAYLASWQLVGPGQDKASAGLRLCRGMKAAIAMYDTGPAECGISGYRFGIAMANNASLSINDTAEEGPLTACVIRDCAEGIVSSTAPPSLAVAYVQFPGTPKPVVLAQSQMANVAGMAVTV